jgi:Ca2+-binding RTX toxin-like protein
MATMTGSVNDDILIGTTDNDVIYGDTNQSDLLVKLFENPNTIEGFGFLQVNAVTEDGQFAIFSVYASGGISGLYMIDSVTGEILDLGHGGVVDITEDGSSYMLANGAVVDLATGQITHSAVGLDGYDAEFSADGTKYIFCSEENDLATGDNNNLRDVFIRNLATEQITKVSTNSSGEAANGATVLLDVFDGGRKVLMQSEATNLDGSGGAQLGYYIKDVETGALERILIGNEDEYGIGLAFNVSISEDGTKLAFLAASSEPPSSPYTYTDLTSGPRYLFVRDLTTGETVLASTNADGQPGTIDGSSEWAPSSRPKISADGNKVIFSSYADNFVEGGNPYDESTYVKNLATGEITRVSDNLFGQAPDAGGARFVGDADFSHIYFSSRAENLAPSDIVDHDYDLFLRMDGQGELSTSDDVLDGGEGDDELHGGAGLDWLFGGAGADTLLGGTETDALFGGDDDDQLMGEDGGDSLDGGAGNDLVLGGRGVDWARGGLGNDRIYGDEDGDALFGEDGDDQLFGGDGDDSLDGGEGRDELDGGAGVDWLYGGAGDDTLRGGLNGDALFGDAGTDSLYGDDGNDSLDGGEGQDVLSGGSGDDWLFGQAREDWLFGDEGSDVLFGGTHDDRLDGGAGGDSLDGGSGNDILIGGAGIDVLFGGSGFDRFRYYSPDEGGDVIRDFFAAEDGFQILSSNFGFGYTGALQAGDLTSGAGLPFDLESGAGPKFYFETETRGLWFDPTGGTTEDIVIVAGLETGLVTADDIVLI